MEVKQHTSIFSFQQSNFRIWN